VIEDVLIAIQSFFLREPFLVLLDIADILLVAFIAYRVIVMLKGTRAMQMGIGLALVYVVYHLSERFGLITVWALLDALLTYVVLIVVILFQSDIRRALMRVGRRPFLKARTARDTHVLEEVIKAATALAQKRIGALMVFERDASLDEFIEPGTSLDAAVTKELLYSIFIPSFENPMHDGAVIIKEGRIAQAGAFLPLTGSPKLDRAFGTRHRAAIGISEETDAVVIVVSEERGAVSLCFNGNIIRDLDASSLREALLGLFYRRARKKTKREREASQKIKAEKPEEPAEGRRPIPTPSGVEKIEKPTS
jgi:uncharacterized protein (TIGR00159 family)